jgi:hypothetical protein
MGARFDTSGDFFSTFGAPVGRERACCPSLEQNIKGVVAFESRAESLPDRVGPGTETILLVEDETSVRRARVALK